MPDIPNRRKFERELTEGLSEALATAQRELDKALWRQGLTQGELVNAPAETMRTLQRNLQRHLQQTLMEVYIEAANNFANELSFGVDDDALEKDAITWASTYAGQVARDLVQRREVKLRELASKAPDVELQRRDFLALLLLALGLGAVATIAVTEITNAVSNGEFYTKEALEEQGAEVEEFWDTEEDEKVCPICRPLHGKAKGDGWTIPPPAHPNCRCRIGYRVTSSDGSVEVAFSDTDLRNLLKAKQLKDYNPNQPRDEDGRFGSGGGGSSSGGGGDSSGGDSDTSHISKTPPKWAQEKNRFISKDGDHMDYGHMDKNPANAMADMREKNMSQQHAKNLDDNQKQAVSTYAGESYRDINRGLRGQSDLSAEHQETVRVLDDAIASNSLSEPTVLYRGVTLNDDLRSQFKPGATFTDDAYTSTSFDQANPERFAGGENGAIMRIKASQGQNGVASSSMSEYPEEREFILPRGTEYRISSISQDPNTGRTYIEAEIVS